MSNPDLTQAQVDILAHLSRNRLYITGDAAPEWWVLVGLEIAGYVIDHGPQTLAGGDHCFTLSNRGVSRLWSHYDAIARFPLPKPPTKRQRLARDRWERVRAIREATGLAIGEIFKRAKQYGY